MQAMNRDLKCYQDNKLIIKTEMPTRLPMAEGAGSDGLSRGPATGGLRDLPQWLASCGVSLLLHALLLVGAAAMIERPQAIVWIELFDARLLSAPGEQREERTFTAPLPTAHQVSRDNTPKPPTARITAVAAPEPAAPATPDDGPSSHLQESDTTVRDDSGDRLPGTEETPAINAGTFPARAASTEENAELRYLHEQFDYIRTRVLDRLLYPAVARRQGWRGQVTVSFLVGADGDVENLRIVSSSGHRLLDQQALQAVRAAAPFPPPPTPAIIILPVAFALDPAR